MNRSDLLELIAKRADHITSALAATGKTIDFRDAELRPHVGGVEDCGGAFLDIDSDRATIWLVNGQPLHQVFHVLLHLHRYWVEGVPQLWHQQNGCSGALSSVEAAYEHLVVVPVEIAHYPEAFSYWANYAEEKLFQCQEEGLLPAAVKSHLFQLYLFAQTAFPRSQVADSISVEVWKQGLMDEFEELADIIFKNFEHKPFVMENLCLYLGIENSAGLGLRRLVSDGSDSKAIFKWSSLSELLSQPQNSGDTGKVVSTSVSNSQETESAKAAATPADKIISGTRSDLATALSRSPLTGQTAEEKAKILPRMAFGAR